MEDEALEVLSGVVEGDESSVEGWYLGGWGLWLLAERDEGGRQEAESASARAQAATTTEDGAEITTRNDSDRRSPNPSMQDENDRVTHLRDSRTWLNTCLRFAAQLDYEDDRLREHAQELVQEIERLLLEQGVGLEDEGDEGDEEEGWEGVGFSDEDDRENNSNEDRKSVEEATPTGGGRRKEKDAEQPPVDVIMSGI